MSIPTLLGLGHPARLPERLVSLITAAKAALPVACRARECSLLDELHGEPLFAHRVRGEEAEVGFGECGLHAGQALLDPGIEVRQWPVELLKVARVQPHQVVHP